MHGENLSVFDVPLCENPIGGTAVDDTELFALAQCLAGLYPGARYVQEHVWGKAGQGGGSQFKFGDTNGATRMAFVAAGFPLARVSSQKWTAALRVGSDKDRHVAEVLKLYPWHAALFTPRRGVLTLEQCKGRADAALIATYGRNYNL